LAPYRLTANATGWEPNGTDFFATQAFRLRVTATGLVACTTYF